MTTFATMAYIIAVNVSSLHLRIMYSASNRLISLQCSPTQAAPVPVHKARTTVVLVMTAWRRAWLVSYRSVRTRWSSLKLTIGNEVLKRDLVTATAALAGLSSILFGFLTNLPVALG